MPVLCSVRSWSSGPGDEFTVWSREMDVQTQRSQRSVTAPWTPLAAGRWPCRTAPGQPGGLLAAWAGCEGGRELYQADRPEPRVSQQPVLKGGIGSPRAWSADRQRGALRVCGVSGWRGQEGLGAGLGVGSPAKWELTPRLGGGLAYSGA